jgi:hypothetical protein
MFAQLLEALPPALRHDGEMWIDEARSRAGDARKAARRLRTDGELRAFDAGIDVLDRVEATLARGRDVPVVGAIVPRAAAWLHAGQERLVSMPVEGYDTLNVKQVAERIADLSRLDLLRVRHHERAGKNRKTVLEGIQRELTRREAPHD